MSLDYRKGKRQDYRWVQIMDTSYGITLFLGTFKPLLLGKFFCISALNSDALTLSDIEFEQGWQQLNELAVSPALEKETDIPNFGFDEWYIFNDCPVVLNLPDIFVNYGILEIDDDSAISKSFWQTIDQFQPEVYVSEGTRLTIATKNEVIWQAIESTWIGKL